MEPRWVDVGAGRFLGLNAVSQNVVGIDAEKLGKQIVAFVWPQGQDAKGCARGCPGFGLSR